MLNSISWIVHPLAGLALAYFASVIYSGRGKDYVAVAWAAGLVVLIGVLGADWIAHPAAGMLLGYFGWRGFVNWRRHWPALPVALVAACAFMIMGAGWMVYPIMVMAVMWLASFMFTGWNWKSERQQMQNGSSEHALPEQAGGLPFGLSGKQQPEAVPAQHPAQQTVTAKTQAQAASVAPEDALTALHSNDRLPGEARAQLVALDLRTKEALRHLSAQGIEGSEAGFLARAIRREYAPAAAQAYLKLPPTRADVTPLQDGKTGRDLLCEQLDILLNATQEILDTALHSGGQELLTNGRFLEEKFGKVDKDLKV